MTAPAPEEIASLILKGFDEYRRAFRQITSGARDRFERGDWLAVQRASMDRIELYNASANTLLERVDDLQGGAEIPLERWADIKAAYTDMIEYRKDGALAETVYNTLFRKLNSGQYLLDRYAFVTEPLPSSDRGAPVTRVFGPSPDMAGLLEEVLDAAGFEIGWLDMAADIELIVSTMKGAIPLLRNPQAISFEMIEPVFFRNKGAYLVGRMYVGEHLFPIAIPIQNKRGELYVDTVIWNDDDLSIIFSFTRSYFMVDIDSPFGMVEFLSELMPNKKSWELYTSLGFYKHGKTEFYRGFIEHLETSEDTFVLAEGIKGLVMAVFTLPSYEIVFKIIRDRFAPTKKVTREQVREAYYLVKTHDRVGRMADTQEFANFRLPRARFSDEVLEELERACASSLTLTDDEVIISHLYTERRMMPLNLFLAGASDFDKRQVVDEYGNAIKQLAAANIFPGDMLQKNFGVTRHRRVVFYDYDEICYLTEVNFRKIPAAQNAQEQLAAEPWFDVGPNDVFPEEFENFLFSSDEMREIFKENHADLFTVEYWQDLQQKIRDNQVVDVYPYRRRRSFRRAFSSFTASES